ncbi:hypothetical protein BKA69DRAFT_1043375 [Paraphysoderma sedebokerense]|nr:hypothetical protein BKA69DRAFT_1043375 [Paraphysoderma sedebokerense]
MERIVAEIYLTTVKLLRYITLQIILTLVILAVSFIVYWTYRPYSSAFLNFLELISSVSSSIILLLGLLFYNEQFKTEEQKFVIAMIILVLVMGTTLFVFLGALNELGRQCGKRRRNPTIKLDDCSSINGKQKSTFMLPESDAMHSRSMLSQDGSTSRISLGTTERRELRPNDI